MPVEGDEEPGLYTDVLGFDVFGDTELDDEFRIHHVEPPTHPLVGPWLIEPIGDEHRASIGNQTGDYPSLVFYTGDVAETSETLPDRGVEFTSEPET